MAMPTLFGVTTFRSMPLSNVWRVSHQGEDIAQLERIPRDHISRVVLNDGTAFSLEPTEWGTVVAFEDDVERGRITRRSWWGRSWDLTGLTFGYGLTSDLLPRRWTLRVGNEPVGSLTGTIYSYNRLRVETGVAVPLLALALCWHVLARPWEAAAAPGSLVPGRETDQPDAGGR
jgi:hypothetical protein